MVTRIVYFKKQQSLVVSGVFCLANILLRQKLSGCRETSLMCLPMYWAKSVGWWQFTVYNSKFCITFSFFTVTLSSNYISHCAILKLKQEEKLSINHQTYTMKSRELTLKGYTAVFFILNIRPWSCRIMLRKKLCSVFPPRNLKIFLAKLVPSTLQSSF